MAQHGSVQQPSTLCESEMLLPMPRVVTLVSPAFDLPHGCMHLVTMQGEGATPATYSATGQAPLCLNLQRRC